MNTSIVKALQLVESCVQAVPVYVVEEHHEAGMGLEIPYASRGLIVRALDP